jgi:dTDP-4-dehydrorhamnose 3,5-epimerase-like enzyme
MAIRVKNIKPEFVDERGFISRIVDQEKFKIRSVLHITGKAGSIRGNHYHKKDVHYVYCMKGKFRYSEKSMKNPNSKIESVILKPGDLVLTMPMKAHSMKFIEDTVFLAITTETRNQKAYEEDLIRIVITK